MQSDTEQTLRVLYREAFARRKLMVLAFMVIALATAAAGLYWPKAYTSSTTLLVEDQNAVQPLMERSHNRELVDRARNASEVIYSRSLLLEVLRRTGGLDDDPSPKMVDARIEGLRANTVISNAGDDLIRIQYTGGDAKTVYETTALMAELFIEEMASNRTRQSSAALEFINAQVANYEKALGEAEQRLAIMRSQYPEARDGASSASSERIGELQREIDNIEQQLRTAQIRERSLQQQLSGEVQNGLVASRADQMRTRINELETELSTLRLTYHDTYPDIVVLREQIADLENALAEEEQRIERMRREGLNGGELDPSLRGSEAYRELQAQLYETRTEAEALAEQLESSRAKLEQELARSDRIQDIQARYQEQMRDYEVTQAIYQDLLRRRETARVSLNLNSEQESLTLRVVEPAYESHSPSGPRLVHFAFGGLLLGAGLPLGVLFGLLQVDPRVRSAGEISESLRLPVVGEIPHMNTPREAGAQRRGAVFAGFMVALTVVAVAAVLVLRMQGVI